MFRPTLKAPPVRAHAGENDQDFPQAPRGRGKLFRNLRRAPRPDFPQVPNRTRLTGSSGADQGHGEDSPLKIDRFRGPVSEPVRTGPALRPHVMFSDKQCACLFCHRVLRTCTTLAGFFTNASSGKGIPEYYPSKLFLLSYIISYFNA